MNILFIISLLFTAAVAQEPSLGCNYYLNGYTYGCYLIINNPNGFDNFTEIGGIHFDGFANENVTQVYRWSGVTSIVPSIICDTFPNLAWIHLYNAGLTEIGDSSFSGCSLITELFLYDNRITSISTSAFANLPNLRSLYLDDNLISTLPENVFANQQYLMNLDLSYNPFNEIPGSLFRPLEYLQTLYLNDANISAINNEWFANKGNLYYLYLSSNRISLSAENFVGLQGLRNLNLADNGITEIPADTFLDLNQLIMLDLGNNAINVIHDGAFRGLSRVTSLLMYSCRLRQVQSSYFDDLGNLTYLSLNLNEIEELPTGTFVGLPDLRYIGLSGNRLKTIRRNSFGTLTYLQSIDLNENVVNAVDRALIDDAVNLDNLYFDGNLCANNYFGSFFSSRAQHLLSLARCFRNAFYIVDTVTEAGDEYSFFEGPPPGIAFRVNTGNNPANEVQIALTPFNFIWTPIIEILIGTTNNTRSAIRVNQETNVVTVPTPNIIVQDQWNDFRVTWANQVILVFSGNNTYPFMGFTLEHFFPINFYGLRADKTQATWSVQPLE